jgi:hypothetical protein
MMSMLARFHLKVLFSLSLPISLFSLSRARALSLVISLSLSQYLVPYNALPPQATCVSVQREYFIQY